MSETAPAPVGRPRDPEVDERILAAAIDVYGEAGWTGFSFDAVSRRSGVGKASIYLRWESKEDLLEAALRDRVGAIDSIDTGNMRDDMIQLARHLLDTYLGDAGRAMMRLSVEAPSAPSIDLVFRQWRESQVKAARAIVGRGIARGDSTPDMSVTMLLDTLCGGAINHGMMTPPQLREQVRQRSADYAARLTDFILRPVVTRNEGQTVADEELPSRLAEGSRQ